MDELLLRVTHGNDGTLPRHIRFAYVMSKVSFKRQTFVPCFKIIKNCVYRFFAIKLFIIISTLNTEIIL